MKPSFFQPFCSKSSKLEDYSHQNVQGYSCFYSFRVAFALELLYESEASESQLCKTCFATLHIVCNGDTKQLRMLLFLEAQDQFDVERLHGVVSIPR